MAKSPEAFHAKSKTIPEVLPLPRCLAGDVLEEKHNGATKERKVKEIRQKKVNTKEKPSARKDTSTEETKKPQRKPKDTSGAAEHGTAKHESSGQSAKETRMQPETSKDTTKDSPKSTKAKLHNGRAKLPAELTEKPKIQTETLMDTTKSSRKSTTKACGGITESAEESTTHASGNSKKAKACAEKTKSPDKFTEQRPEVQSGTLECTKNACATQASGDDTILHTTLEKLKIKKYERANAAEVVNEIIKQISKHLKKNSECFKEVEKPLCTGSYYENVKVSETRSIC